MQASSRRNPHMHSDRWDVVGLGENSVDVTYRLPGPPQINGKMPILNARALPGGQVATTLCTCAALGLRTAYAGTFGNDANADAIQSALRSRGVDTTHALIRAVPNRHAIILLDDSSGERCILWQRDPALALAPSELPTALIERARLLHVDATDEETAIAAAHHARAAAVQVTTDIDRVTPLTPELVAAATFPILAADVPPALTGEADAERALRQLGADRDGPICVTLGPNGALLLDGGRVYRAPAFTVRAVDTTGAGDVFRGALIYALLRGDGAERMLRFACAAAAISCTREGAIGGIPTLEEIEALLEK